MFLPQYFAKILPSVVQSLKPLAKCIHWDHIVFFSQVYNRNVLYRSMVVSNLFIPHVVYWFSKKTNKIFPLNALESAFCCQISNLNLL